MYSYGIDGDMFTKYFRCIWYNISENSSSANTEKLLDQIIE